LPSFPLCRRANKEYRRGGWYQFEIIFLSENSKTQFSTLNFELCTLFRLFFLLLGEWQNLIANKRKLKTGNSANRQQHIAR